MCQVNVDVPSSLELSAPKQNQMNHMAVLHGTDGASKNYSKSFVHTLIEPLFQDFEKALSGGWRASTCRSCKPKNLHCWPDLSRPSAEPCADVNLIFFEASRAA